MKAIVGVILLLSCLCAPAIAASEVTAKSVAKPEKTSRSVPKAGRSDSSTEARDVTTSPKQQTLLVPPAPIPLQKK